jgi:hypothetical protein
MPSRAGFENSIPPWLSFVVQEAAAAPDEVFGSVQQPAIRNRARSPSLDIDN